MTDKRTTLDNQGESKGNFSKSMDTASTADNVKPRLTTSQIANDMSTDE